MNEPIEFSSAKPFEIALTAIPILFPVETDGSRNWKPVSEGFPANFEENGKQYAKILNLLVTCAGQKSNIPVTGAYSQDRKMFFGFEVRPGGVVTLSPIEFPLRVTHWAEIPKMNKQEDKGC